MARVPANPVDKAGRSNRRRFRYSPDALIAVGAVAGVFGRYASGLAAARLLSGPFPVDTLAVNLVGCLIIGIIQTLALDLLAVRRELQLLLVTGFCGGFTTFSTFSLETLQLLQDGYIATVLGYQVASLGGGLIAVVSGSAVAHLLGRRMVDRRRG